MASSRGEESPFDHLYTVARETPSWSMIASTPPTAWIAEETRSPLIGLLLYGHDGTSSPRRMAFARSTIASSSSASRRAIEPKYEKSLPSATLRDRADFPTFLAREISFDAFIDYLQRTKLNEFYNDVSSSIELIDSMNYNKE